jgi:hypothetical protein
MWLSPNGVREIGLQIMKICVGRKSQERLVLEFHKHYASSPLDLAEMGYDLCNNHQKYELSEKEIRKRVHTILSSTLLSVGATKECCYACFLVRVVRRLLPWTTPMEVDWVHCGLGG